MLQNEKDTSVVSCNGVTWNQLRSRPDLRAYHR